MCFSVGFNNGSSIRNITASEFMIKPINEPEKMNGSKILYSGEYNEISSQILRLTNEFQSLIYQNYKLRD